ncbi:hypothetical protein CTAYLR_008968 [Chrysophaeum taylorii]|uniref:Membrane magnesium transporter n=1 Tax=Chrysophaeum taylorii TaxID=2483200 RepID=A0AAD7UJ97_9STRA|nr:hypothetical protein CTAYLR_008968 [Chrysophaeum taylorii]
MLSSVVARCVSILSVVLLVHAGFSTIHFKGIAPPHAPLPPTDVVVEVVIAVVLAVLSSLALMPEFKKVKLADVRLSPAQMDVAFHCPDFMIFSHRGRSIARRRAAVLNRSKKEQK